MFNSLDLTIRLIGVLVILSARTSALADKYEEALNGSWTVFGAIPVFENQLSNETSDGLKNIPDEITITDKRFDLGEFLFLTDEGSSDTLRTGNFVYISKRLLCLKQIRLVI